MLVVEVNVVDAEALEGGVAGGVDVFRFAADAPLCGIFLFADVGELCGEKDFVAAEADGLADELLVVSYAVHVGGIQEVDAQIEMWG